MTTAAPGQPAPARAGATRQHWVGVALAALSNVAFGAGNLVIIGYPSQAGLLAFRGAAAAVLTAPEVLRSDSRRPSRHSIALGVLQALHMLSFTTLLRHSPAWFAPSILAAAPALLWAWGPRGPRASNGRDRLAGIAVLVMLAAAAGFTVDPSSLGLVWYAVPLGGLTTVLVASRYLLATRWAGSYQPAHALALAFGAQALLGLGLTLTGLPLSFVALPIAVAAVSSAFGHRLSFAAASRTASTVIAALAPVSTGVTVAGAALLFGQMLPSLVRLLALVVWLAGSAVVAARLQPRAAAPAVLAELVAEEVGD